MVEKKRRKRGAELPQTKLSDDDVRGIMYLWRNEKFGVSEIARIYGVHRCHVSRTVRGVKGGRVLA